MSIIAGRIAVQIGTTLLHQPAGGKGKLLGGLPGLLRSGRQDAVGNRDTEPGEQLLALVLVEVQAAGEPS